MCNWCGCADDVDTEDQVVEEPIDDIWIDQDFEPEVPPEVPPEVRDWAESRGMQADPYDCDTEGVVEDDYDEE